MTDGNWEKNKIHMKAGICMRKFIGYVLTCCLGFAAGVTVMRIEKFESDEKLNSRCEKFLSYYTMLNLWMKIKQEGRSLDDFFVDNNYSDIAIYGMGEMGQRLAEELLNGSVNIRYAIDKNMKEPYKGINVMDNDGEFEPVDAVVVTATYDFESIKKQLQKKIAVPVISLNEIVFELRNRGKSNEKI